MDKILMPRELTAENGAKFILIGEFFETIEVECTDCDGDQCDRCDGTGVLVQEIPVSWTNIKEIYKAAVSFFGEEINET